MKMRVQFEYLGRQCVGTVDDENNWDVGASDEDRAAAAFAKDMAEYAIDEGHIACEENQWASAVVQYAYMGSFQFAEQLPPTERGKVY